MCGWGLIIRIGLGARGASEGGGFVGLRLFVCVFFFARRWRRVGLWGLWIGLWDCHLDYLWVVAGGWSDASGGERD